MADNSEIFRSLTADDPNPEYSVVESVCMNCFKNGKTTLFLTKIPFYKEVVIASFYCEFCQYRNNDIQSASEIQLKGVRLIFRVTNANDLNRRVVKSDFTSIQIPEIDLEIPSQSQKGEITTIEGIIERTKASLNQDQEIRSKNNPDVAEKIVNFISLLENLKEVKSEFTIILEDISGNSFIENPNAPQSDNNCKTEHFVRSKEQDEALGIYSSTSDKEHMLKPISESSWPLEELHGEVMQFQTLCHSCKSPCETNMKLTNIPHFKDVVIMATTCEACGFRTNEVKSGGGIEDTGIRFEILITSKEDLNRDILKSETCSLNIPELKCDVGPSALGARFTTVEGLLVAMKNQLSEHGFMFQDSGNEDYEKRFEVFLSKIDNILNLSEKATLVLDDPAGNSYVQSLEENQLDDRLKVTRYPRSFEQNEELGLNDIKTENY